MGFEYYEPTTLLECIELLNHYGPEASLLAGGTDLVIKLRLRMARPRAVISLGCLEELKKIARRSNGSLEIGAMKTLREIEKSGELADGLDLLRQGAGWVSSMQVRNVATLGGNSCNASPAADTVPGLIAAEALARIMGPQGERLLPLEDFFVGPGETALQTGEILAGFRVPAPLPLSGGVYRKYAIRGEVDIAIVGVAVYLTLDKSHGLQKVRIVLGGVAPTPLRARKAEELLVGQRLEEKLITEAARMSAEESRPISDQRASAQYRRDMVKVWTRYALREAFEKASRAQA
jgi:carbon-monoxide dehydrogenase medium subunit